MSDSLNATVIVIESVLTISTNAEFEPLDDEDELEPPRLPAVAPPPLAPAPLPEELDDEPLLAAFDVEPPLTVSPGWRAESDTTVPLVGA